MSTNTVIIIGRKELFSFAERHSSRRLSDYSGLADGHVLCCLFNLVFPDLRIRPAAAQTHSTTQRTHRNWEQLFRRFARLHIPLNFLQPTQLLRSGDNVECGFSSLVLFYFLHHLSKRADFSAEFALDVREDVTAFLQSTDCIVTLLLGNALTWSAIPEALVETVRRHDGFQRSAAAVEAAEEAAAEFYRANFTRLRRRRTLSCTSNDAGSSHQDSKVEKANETEKRMVSAEEDEEHFVSAPSEASAAGLNASKEKNEMRKGAAQTTDIFDTLTTEMQRHTVSKHSSSGGHGALSLSSAPPENSSALSSKRNHRHLYARTTSEDSDDNNDGNSSSSSNAYNEASPVPRAPLHEPSARSVQFHCAGQHRKEQDTHQRECSTKHHDPRKVKDDAMQASLSAAAAAVPPPRTVPVSSSSLPSSTAAAGPAFSGKQTSASPSVHDFDSSIDMSGMTLHSTSMGQPDVSRRLLTRSKSREGEEEAKSVVPSRRVVSRGSSTSSAGSATSSSSSLSGATSSGQAQSSSVRGSTNGSVLGARHTRKLAEPAPPLFTQMEEEDRADVPDVFNHRRRAAHSAAASVAPREASAATRTAYRAAASVAPRSSRSASVRSPTSPTASLFHSREDKESTRDFQDEVNASAASTHNTREAFLTAALRAKEEECESLQLRVAQLLSLVANVKTNAMATSAPPTEAHPHVASTSTSAASAEDRESNAQHRHLLQEYAQRIAELEAELRVHQSRAAAFGGTREDVEQAKASPTLSDATPTASAEVEAELAALTSDVVDDETGESIHVEENANLLHCLLLEHLQDSPRNRTQMQQWLWGMLAAHHTLEGRLHAAKELIRRLFQEKEFYRAQLSATDALPSTASHSASASASPSPVQMARAVPAGQPDSLTAASARGAASSYPRSQSTVAAAFLAADEQTSAAAAGAVYDRTSIINDLKKENNRRVNSDEEVMELRRAFYAELEAQHAREHQLTCDLHTAQRAAEATAQRAVRRERLWKELCAAVYAAEQSSFAIVDCETAADVEAHLQARDDHYALVETITQQLVEDSKQGPIEVVNTTGVAPASEGEKEEGKEGQPCVALQTLVTHLQEERGELLGDVARLHALLAAMQSRRSPDSATKVTSDAQESPSPFSVAHREQCGSTSAHRLHTSSSAASNTQQLPPPPALRPLHYPPLSATSTTTSTKTAPLRDDKPISAKATLPLDARLHQSGAEVYSEAPHEPRGLSSLLREDAAVYPVM